jgi:uncharacterized alkaline shock family protein YloU
MSVVIEERHGSVVVPAATLTSIVVTAAHGVDGARVRRRRRDVDVQVDGIRAHVSVELCARYGVVLPQLARDVQTAVAQALQEMCGLEVAAVDVSVEELE